MSPSTVETVARRATGRFAPGAAQTSSGADPAVLARSPVASASKSGKKARKRAKKKGKKKCQTQVGQCGEFFEDLCVNDPEGDPAACEARFSPCCEFFAQCQATAFFDCIFANAA